MPQLCFAVHIQLIVCVIFRENNRKDRNIKQLHQIEFWQNNRFVCNTNKTRFCIPNCLFAFVDYDVKKTSIQEEKQESTYIIY